MHFVKFAIFDTDLFLDVKIKSIVVGFQIEGGKSTINKKDEQ